MLNGVMLWQLENSVPLLTCCTITIIHTFKNTLQLNLSVNRTLLLTICDGKFVINHCHALHYSASEALCNSVSQKKYLFFPQKKFENILTF